MPPSQQPSGIQQNPQRYKIRGNAIPSITTVNTIETILFLAEINKNTVSLDKSERLLNKKETKIFGESPFFRTFAAFSGMRGLTRPLIFILQPQSVNRILTDKLTDTLSVVLMTVWGLIIGI